MSSMLYIEGIKKPDGKWQQMKAVWEACTNANVDIPDEVDEYFNGDAPDSAGVIVPLASEYQMSHHGKRNDDGVTLYHEDGRNGFEVDLSQLPPDIQKLRFYVSY